MNNSTKHLHNVIGNGDYWLILGSDAVGMDGRHKKKHGKLTPRNVKVYGQPRRV